VNLVLAFQSFHPTSKGGDGKGERGFLKVDGIRVHFVTNVLGVADNESG